MHELQCNWQFPTWRSGWRAAAILESMSKFGDMSPQQARYCRTLSITYLLLEGARLSSDAFKPLNSSSLHAITCNCWSRKPGFQLLCISLVKRNQHRAFVWLYDESLQHNPAVCSVDVWGSLAKLWIQFLVKLVSTKMELFCIWDCGHSDMSEWKSILQPRELSCFYETPKRSALKRKPSCTRWRYSYLAL